LLALTVTLRSAVALAAGIGILKDRQLPNQLWLLPARDLIAVGIWAAGFAGRKVVWRGNQFTLENGRLRP
jgi:ceramide glucosyltransferase